MIQTQVLNYVLKNQDSSIITVNDLTVDFFSDYPEEFNFIKNHINKYSKVPDMETFLNTFPDFETLTVNEPTNYLLDELVKDRKGRFATESFMKVREFLANKDPEGAMQVINEVANKSFAFTSLNAKNIFEDMSRFDVYEDKIINKDKYFIKTGFKELDTAIGGWNRMEDLVTIVARNGIGKCLEKGTKVLMADGAIKNVEDVKVGDKVQSLNRVNTVLALHNGKSKGYKIIPNLGDSFTVSANHILTLMKRNNILRKGNILHTTDNTFTLVDMSIEDYLALSKNQQRLYELYRPGVDYQTKELKIPPYILGLWLGDGTSCRVSLTNIDPEIINEWKTWGHQYTDTIREYHNTYDITDVKNSGKKSEILDIFRYYNLLNNKHIPIDYLTGDRSQRLELLAGIIDTDGYVSTKYREKSNTFNSTVSICLKSKILIEQIAQLARGLNLRVGKIKERLLNNKVKGLTSYYTIAITGKDLGDIPCRLERKKPKYSSSQRTLNLTNFKVEEVKEIEYYGFMADGDHRYLLADNTLTHNTWVLLKCAAAAGMAGYRVGIYSGEMSTDSVGYRIDTMLGHISNGALTYGNDSIKSQYEEYLHQLKEQITGQCWIITPEDIGGFAKPSTLRAFVEKYNIDILFVDQYSLMRDDEGADNDRVRLANISTGLKLLQTTKKIPVITVAQQNREKLEGQSKAFDTTQIMGCDLIGQNSSVVLFLDKKDDLMKIYLGKLRQSKDTGKFLNYRINLNYGDWEYVPGEDDVTANADDGDRKYTPVDSQGIEYTEDEVSF